MLMIAYFQASVQQIFLFSDTFPQGGAFSFVFTMEFSFFRHLKKSPYHKKRVELCLFISQNGIFYYLLKPYFFHRGKTLFLLT